MQNLREPFVVSEAAALSFWDRLKLSKYESHWDAHRTPCTAVSLELGVHWLQVPSALEAQQLWLKLLVNWLL